MWIHLSWSIYGSYITHESRRIDHYSGVIMGTMASQITSLTIVYSITYSGADQRKHQSLASLVFLRGFHQWPVNSPFKRASIAEKVSIWRGHHGCHLCELDDGIQNGPKYRAKFRDAIVTLYDPWAAQLTNWCLFGENNLHWLELSRHRACKCPCRC